MAQGEGKNSWMDLRSQPPHVLAGSNLENYWVSLLAQLVSPARLDFHMVPTVEPTQISRLNILYLNALPDVPRESICRFRSRAFSGCVPDRALTRQIPRAYLGST